MFTKGWYDEGVVSLISDHLVNLINFGINESTDLWEHVLDDFVDNTGRHLYEPVQEGAGHLNVDLSYVDLGGFNDLPVDIIVRGRFNDEFDGQISNVNMRSLEWDEFQSFKLSINFHVNVDSTNFDFDLIGSVDVSDGLSSESRHSIKVNVLEVEGVERALHLVVDIECLIVQLEVGENWNEGLHDVVD